ncbi:hypothetical protein PV797_04855 [Clostridiaceae bacterium M8S5]|nr:hypothetical protein PV797_04855 [Clostridiaceae bacterium M8S5]
MVEAINWNIVIAIATVFMVVIFTKYISKYLKKKDLDLYREIKLGLLIFGYTFKDNQIKKIADLTYEVVSNLQSLASVTEEIDEAIKQVSKRLLDEFEIDIEPEALDMIVQIAYTLLPEDNK